MTTVTSFSTEFAYAGLRFHVQQLEALARKKFTISPNNVVGGQTAAGMTAGASGSGSTGSLAASTGDDFYMNNVPHFPISSPITMPVIVRDATVVPSKWQHGMADELILAFWKMVDFTKSAMNVVESQGKAWTRPSTRCTRPPWGRHRG